MPQEKILYLLQVIPTQIIRLLQKKKMNGTKIQFFGLLLSLAELLIFVKSIDIKKNKEGGTDKKPTSYQR